MSAHRYSVRDHDSGAPFWGIVDHNGHVTSDGGRLMIFKTRKEARNRNKRVTGTVRKVFIRYEKRSEGGA